jgi:hypothetical protein
MLLQFVYNQRVPFFEWIKNLSHTEKSLHFILELKLHFLFWVANALNKAARFVVKRAT